MMASPPPGAKRAGGAGRGGRWVLGSGGRECVFKLQVTPSTGCPGERHMAKIMANSCKESRIWLVSLGSITLQGLSRGYGAACPGTGRGLTRHSWDALLQALPDPALGEGARRGKPLLPAHCPLMWCGHERKGFWPWGSNPAPLFAISKHGPNTSLLWA